KYCEGISVAKICDAVILQEETSNNNVVLKPFQYKGLEVLFKKIPSAVIVPVSINNSWKMLKYGKFPLGLGTHITFTVHEPIKLSTFVGDKETLINHVETVIKKHIHP